MTTPDDQHVGTDDLRIEQGVDDLAVVFRPQPGDAPELVVDQPEVVPHPAEKVRRRRYLRFGPHNLRMGFRRWRRTRPFWAGLWTILGGLFMLYGPATAFKVILVSNIVWIGIAVGAFVAALGLLVWVNPAHRHLYGVLIVIGSLVSIITSDIGGFVIGLLLGLFGGSMAFAWMPTSQFPKKKKHQHRHGADDRRASRKVAVAKTG